MNIDPNDPRPENQCKRRLGVGIWEDMNGHIHFSIPELLAHFDLPDTPAERRAVTHIMRQLLREQRPGGQLIFRESPDDPGRPLEK